MKIIDLLNKIANGEEVPEKIKINNVIYEYRSYMYCTEKANYQDIEDYLFGKWNFNILNEEVEIIEEEKKIPKKLDYIHPNISCSYNESELLLRIEANKDKINSIIDYLESKEKGE